MSLRHVSSDADSERHAYVLYVLVIPLSSVAHK